MSDIDVSMLSKSELKQLLQRSQRRLSRVKSKPQTPEIKSSDERVKVIADRVRDLSRELGLKRSDVLAAVADNMRIAVGTSADELSSGTAATLEESGAPAATTRAPTRAAKAQRGSKATKGNVRAERKAPQGRTRA